MTLALMLYDPVSTFSGMSFMASCGLENVFDVPTTARVIWRWGPQLSRLVINKEVNADLTMLYTNAVALFNLIMIILKNNLFSEWF